MSRRRRDQDAPDGSLFHAGAPAHAEEHYRRLFEETPIAKLVCDATTLAILDANRAAIERYGYPVAELLTMDLPSLHLPQDRARVAAAIRAHSSTLSSAGEWTQCTRTGAKLHVKLNCNRFLFDGRPLLLIVAFDITQRLEAQALFRAAVSVSPNGLVMIDAQGTIRLVNRQIEAIFGYGEGELLGQPLETLLPPRLRAIHAEHRAAFLQNPVPRRMGAGRELYGLHKSGRELPIEIGLAPTIVEGQTLVLASVIDISERRQAEQSIKDAAARWLALMDGAMDGIMLVGPDGTIVEVNRRMAAILGRSIEDIVGRHVLSFVVASERLEGDALREAIDVGSGQVLGVRLVRADESVAAVDFTMSTVELGATRLLLAIGRDVTEQRMLEQQYRQAQKMEAVGRLAGGVAHDFNNMLTAILGYAELIAKSLPPESAAHSDLEEIVGATHRAAGLTRQLLAFSRQQVLTPSVLDLNDVVRDVRRMLERLIGEDISIRLELAPELHKVLVDRGQVAQVLMNLSVNARDAMPQGGTLTIHTENVLLTEEYAERHQSVKPGDYVMVAFSDTGVGMSEEVRARVFEPFFATQEKGKGTGLGLATSYGIIKQSGGFIWVYAEPGLGATFKLYLPGFATTVGASPPPPITEQLHGTETILLAEDDDVLRRLTENVLRHYGYTVIAAANAADAIALAGTHQGSLHLLVTDLIMPGESGRGLASRLLDLRPNVKVLYMSGYTGDAVTRQGALEPGSGFLQKPFTPAALARKIREILDAPRTTL